MNLDITICANSKECSKHKTCERHLIGLTHEAKIKPMAYAYFYQKGFVCDYYIKHEEEDVNVKNKSTITLHK